MSRSVSLGFVSLVTVCLVVFTMAASAEGTEQDSVPSWQLGVSQWSGNDYEFAAPVRGHDDGVEEAAPSGSGLPYTMPVDPKANTQGNQPSFEMPLTSPSPSGNYLTNRPTSQAAPLVGAPPATPGVEIPGGSVPNPAPVVDLPSDLPAPVAPLSSPITDKLSSPQAVETPPLEEKVVRWYDYPRRWMRGWDSHAEFGIDGSDGNADTLAVQTGLEFKRKSERSRLSVDVDYRQASSRNVTVEDNGRFNVDYDYIFADSPWSGFAKYGMEWDKFKAFNLRLNVNSGIGYFWIRDDATTLVTRFGAGASREIGAPVDDWIAEAVFGLEAERQLTSRQKIKGKVDYFPAWENFDDYRLVTDLAWEILLDGSENLSLKLAATDRYDSTPQGALPNDVYYSLLLLYKF